MKRLLVVVLGVLGFAAPALADEASSARPKADEQPVLMSDAEFDGVVAGGAPLAIVHDTQIAFNIAVVIASGGSTVYLTQIAVAIGQVSPPSGVRM